MRSKGVSRTTEWNLNYLRSTLLARVILVQSAWMLESLLRGNALQTLRKTLVKMCWVRILRVLRKYAHAQLETCCLFLLNFKRLKKTVTETKKEALHYL